MSEKDTANENVGNAGDENKVTSKPVEAKSSKTDETQNPDPPSSSNTLIVIDEKSVPKSPRKIRHRILLLSDDEEKTEYCDGTKQKIEEYTATTSKASKLYDSADEAYVKTVKQYEAAVSQPPKKRESSFNPKLGDSLEVVRPTKKMKLLPTTIMNASHGKIGSSSPMPDDSDASETQSSRSWPCIKTAVRKIMETKASRKRKLMTPETKNPPAEAKQPPLRPTKRFKSTPSEQARSLKRQDSKNTDSPASDSSSSSQMTSISVGSVISCSSSDNEQPDDEQNTGSN